MILNYVSSYITPHVITVIHSRKFLKIICKGLSTLIIQVQVYWGLSFFASEQTLAHFFVTSRELSNSYALILERRSFSAPTRTQLTSSSQPCHILNTDVTISLSWKTKIIFHGLRNEYKTLQNHFSSSVTLQWSGALDEVLTIYNFAYTLKSNLIPALRLRWKSTLGAKTCSG